MMRTPRQLYWEDIRASTEIPPITLSVTYEKVVMTPMATWDLFPGHSNPHYAAAQGQKTIYLNTTVLQGFADRVLTDWAGYMTFVARRKLVMLGSVYAGDILTGEGRVDRVYRTDSGGGIDTSISLRTNAGPVCNVTTTAILPMRKT
jgi:acyl dehydratase